MQFAGRLFLQIFGIAMGTSLAPLLSTIYLGVKELEIRGASSGTLIKWPLVYWSYIDDVLCIFQGSYEEFKFIYSLQYLTVW